MAGWIVVVRRPSFAVWEARFAVFIDGRRVAGLGRDGTEDFQVEAGMHRVRVRQWGYSSRTLKVSVADGDTVVVRTRIRFWMNYLTSLSGSPIGGFGYWLFAHGPTPTRVAGFSIGVAAVVVLFWSRVVISLRPDPAPTVRRLVPTEG